VAEALAASAEAGAALAVAVPSSDAGFNAGTPTQDGGGAGTPTASPGHVGEREREMQKFEQEQRHHHQQRRDGRDGRGPPRAGGGRGGGGGGGPGGLAMPDGTTFKLPADAILQQDVPLPRRMASCVIGIRGSSVQRLRRESGARVHIRPANGREELDQVVEIEGSIEAVSEGRGMDGLWMSAAAQLCVKGGGLPALTSAQLQRQHACDSPALR
jgi:hypothetical protein